MSDTSFPNSIKDSTYNSKLQKLLSTQLNLEFSSFYLYRYLSTLSQHLSLPGHKHFFDIQFKEEIKHATGIMDFAAQNNILLDFMPINLPCDLEKYKQSKTKLNNTNITDEDEDDNVLMFFTISLEHEESEYKNIMKIYKLANENDDFRTCVFLDAYIEEQCVSIRELVDNIRNWKRCKNSKGLYIFDQNLLNVKK